MVAEELRAASLPADVRAALAELQSVADGLSIPPDAEAFYEAFLTAFDPDLRRSHGAFYTPQPVVAAQVRWVDRLVRQAGQPEGLASPSVTVIDPAMGTGAYLLGVVAHLGAGAWADNLVGRELMAGPYAVSEGLLAMALAETGARPRLALGDSLLERLAIPARVRVCLGNPPYGRHDAGDGPDAALLAEFADLARAAGHGGDLKNLYNLYTYFWAWGIREVFQADPDASGVVCFITASSYLAGDAFVGLRERLRRECDDIWIVDLGGEGRGARQDGNVFAIQTPVAITLAARFGSRDAGQPARVRYARLTGSRAEKLAALDAAGTLDDLAWSEVGAGWQAPFLRSPPTEFTSWPALTDLMPWQHSGVQPKRTWPIAPDPESLRLRWRAMLSSEHRATAMRATDDRHPDGTYASDPAGGPPASPLASLPPDAPPPAIVSYQFRSFDRQWLLADGRLLSRPRPSLWRAHGPRQLYFATSLSLPPGHGPALTVSRAIPDLHVFCGRGAKDVLPLYRNAEATDPNVADGLLQRLSEVHARPVSVAELASYLYGILAHPGYTSRFYDALTTASIHVPLTADADCFGRVAEAGAELLSLHLDGARSGRAQCVKAPVQRSKSIEYDDQGLQFGGGRYSPVTPEVMAFEVSGLKVVDSWLGYRLAKPRGKRGSPLDDVHAPGWPAEWTSELLSLLWTIEATFDLYSRLDGLLEQVLAGPLLPRR